jgi:Family of unknown function (DUF5338)
MSSRTTDYTIRALTSKRPTTRTGFVRRLLPEIEVALKSGHTIKTIWKTLVHQRDKGFSYKLFCLYLRRLQPTNRTETAPTNGGNTPIEPTLRASARTEVEFDPLANVKEAEATRPGFYYRGTEDLEELVYGRKNNHGKQKRRTT